MFRGRGFTLIELVVVIIILGVLAALAIPKFFDFEKEARISVLRGVGGALSSASAMVYSKSLLEGKEMDATNTLDINGKTVAITFGYPSVVWPTAWENAIDIDTVAQRSGNAPCDVDLCVDDNVNLLGVIGGPATAARSMLIYPKGKSIISQCFAWYNQDTAGASVAIPRIGTKTDGC